MGTEVIERNENPLAVVAGSGRLPASVEIESRRAMVEVLCQVQAARALPRRELMPEIEAELMELARNPEFAEKAVYAKPAGKDKQGNEVFVEGKSVYLAKQMASMYPNFQWRVVEHGKVGDETQVEVSCWDVEKNSRPTVIVTVSHERWNADSKSTYLEKNPAKIKDMVKSESSKTVRNLIFDELPKLLADRVYEACQSTNDRVAVKLIDSIDKTMSTFAEQFEVTEEQIRAFLKVKNNKEIKPKHIRRMRALYQGIKQGEIKASDVWKEAKDPIPVKGEADEKKSGKISTQPTSDSTSDSTPPAGQIGASSDSQESLPEKKSEKPSKGKNGSSPADNKEKETSASSKSQSEPTSESRPDTSESSNQEEKSGSSTADSKAKPEPLEKPTAQEQEELEDMFR